ncbi:putative arabinan endo- -alpha-L-arabinosidase [Rosellinia necatrix]|uniref:Putative arabinan endo--alpha-L-arabinosidase n=1 Tax=Rosellinia necatrix TaxID=77044 RepID=A0A1W2TWE1_ROSNE|nr:putative arabinan endo- -alpha-L-arabinosidase [Rosellinia necatrix]
MHNTRTTIVGGLCILANLISNSSAYPSKPQAPSARQTTRHNPIDLGWYADPDAIKFGDTYWVYATLSISFGDQKSFDAFSSPDLVTWTPHKGVYQAATSAWVRDSLWAPCVVRGAVDDNYYMYYTANNPVANEGTTGIGVGVASSPAGPFLDVVDGPIVGTQVNNANAMDQQVFRDDDGTQYLVWGGSFVNIAPLASDMKTLGAWPDGSTDAVEITPNEGFGEGSYMLKRGGMYYFMWSEGGYGTPDYRVAYAMSESITGPFERIGLMLSKDGVVADGPGHHSVIREEVNGEDVYWIAYHRRYIGDDVADNRVVAVDRLYFNEDGTIKPVIMT